MNGIERRAERLLISTGMTSIPEFRTAICAVGSRASANPGATEVLFHCAHGYGEIYMPTVTWKRMNDQTRRTMRRAVAEEHKRHGLVSDVPEFNAVVLL